MHTEILKKFATFTGHDNRYINVTVELFLKDDNLCIVKVLADNYNRFETGIARKVRLIGSTQSVPKFLLDETAIGVLPAGWDEGMSCLPYKGKAALCGHYAIPLRTVTSVKTLVQLKIESRVEDISINNLTCTFFDREVLPGNGIFDPERTRVVVPTELKEDEVDFNVVCQKLKAMFNPELTDVQFANRLGFALGCYKGMKELLSDITKGD